MLPLWYLVRILLSPLGLLLLHTPSSMGGCESASQSPIQPIEMYLDPPAHLREYRRDGKDIAVVRRLIEEAYRSQAVHSHEELVAFADGAWRSFGATNDFLFDESVPENLREGVDCDHWYEINCTNAALFKDFRLDGVPELLPGRLFSTRMPRNIAVNISAAEAFKLKARQHNLHTVLILTEKFEYDKYAGADLESFYSSLNLSVINRPIRDLCVPDEEAMVANIKDVTLLLSDGRSVLVHCAGGSGRTGMVIAGVVRNAGVLNPLQWVRSVRSAYVETSEQERFVDSMPLVVDPALLNKCPTLARVIAAAHLLRKGNQQEYSTTDDSPSRPLDASVRHDLECVFKLLDADQSGYLSTDELRDLFEGLGCSEVFGHVVKRLDRDGDGEISMNEFVDLMTD